MSVVGINAQCYRPCPRCLGEGELVTADHRKGQFVFWCDVCSKLYTLLFNDGGILLDTRS